MSAIRQLSTPPLISVGFFFLGHRRRVATVSKLVLDNRQTNTHTHVARERERETIARVSSTRTTRALGVAARYCWLGLVEGELVSNLDSIANY